MEKQPEMKLDRNWKRKICGFGFYLDESLYRICITYGNSNNNIRDNNNNYTTTTTTTTTTIDYASGESIS